jgi:dTDP-glucose pyrophosphorylase
MNVIYSTPESLKRDIKSIMPNFVIPMAGRGERFLKAGYKTPKYMVKAGSKTLFEWALEGIPLDLANKLIFICLQEHEEKYNVTSFIKKTINDKYPFLNDKYIVIFIKKVTRGQAETVLAAKKYINNSTSLVIYNIDSYFSSSRLRQRLISAKNQKIDGILGVFYDNNPKWSFAKINKKGFVSRTTEKNPISNIASTGLYVFTEGMDFVNAVEYALKTGMTTNDEFYIAPLYNILIKQNKKYIVDPVEEFWSLGTPEDLNFFVDNYLKAEKNN